MNLDIIPGGTLGQEQALDFSDDNYLWTIKGRSVSPGFFLKTAHW